MEWSPIQSVGSKARRQPIKSTDIGSIQSVVRGVVPVQSVGTQSTVYDPVGGTERDAGGSSCCCLLLFVDSETVGRQAVVRSGPDTVSGMVIVDPVGGKGTSKQQ